MLFYMIISNKDLINLPVETRSGDSLGKVTGFDIDADNGQILKYYVSGSNIFKLIISDEKMLVDKDQVIEITREKMVVIDLLIKERDERKKINKVEVEKIEPVITSKSE